MRVQAPKYKSGSLPVSERPAVLSRNCPTQKREIHDESLGILISNASTPSLSPLPRENRTSAAMVRSVPPYISHIPTGTNGQLSQNGNGTPIPCLEFYFIHLLLSDSSSKHLEVDPRRQPIHLLDMQSSLSLLSTLKRKEGSR
ncbi:hypothetical protein CDAR_408761 [Caerostris darwini]|uniref:Uncharacterized protein n=1 Tax=Caerostris darwini TaxID=1538125 RepID=A0AAV4MD78_9ARAC|nr:hypothetical protein CDAR_408761 [Caerostris darwini]